MLYLVFIGDHYYPSGGWRDLLGIYATLDEARSSLRLTPYPDWWMIVELNPTTHEHQVVEEEYGPYA